MDDSPWRSSHPLTTPAFNILLAFNALSLGCSSTDCAQLTIAVLGVLTVGGVFLLARRIVNDEKAALTAGMGAFLMGTFVFTTGSVWKESLGMATLALLFLAFIERKRLQYRALMFVILILLPLIHHLVSAIGFLFVVYLLSWSYLSAMFFHSFRRRHVVDLLTIIVPVLVGVVYFELTMPNLLATFESEVEIALFASVIVLIILICFLVLSVRRHSRLTFAPIVGTSLAIVVLLDFYGFLFPYTPSATSLYLLLVVVSSILVSIAWYGAEIVVETQEAYKAIPLALLVAPLTIMLFAIAGGFSTFSHKVVYRSFDFLDFFIFLGCGVAVSTLSNRNFRKYLVVGFVILVCLASSFPFGYWSRDLLGVRHDTQEYEIDALSWIHDTGSSSHVVSDERLSYIANASFGLMKDAALPFYVSSNSSLPRFAYLIMESSWTSVGVNDFPNGRIVVPKSIYASVLARSSVVYVGGPIDDQIVVFVRPP